MELGAKLFVKNYREKEIFFKDCRLAEDDRNDDYGNTANTPVLHAYIYIYLWSRDNNDSGNKLSLAATASTIFMIMTIINWWTTARRTDRLLLLERI